MRRARLVVALALLPLVACDDADPAGGDGGIVATADAVPPDAALPDAGSASDTVSPPDVVPPVDAEADSRPPGARVLTTCPTPKVDAPLTLLNASSTLTDVVGFGDRFVLSWVDRTGVATAKAGTLAESGTTLAQLDLGTPGLEPRVAVGGEQVGLAHLSAADPSRRDYAFAVVNPALGLVGVVRTIAATVELDPARTALAWTSQGYGLVTGASTLELRVLRPDGGEVKHALGAAPTLQGRTISGVDQGFALVGSSDAGAYVETRSAVDGTAKGRLTLPAGATAVSVVRDPTTGGALVALAGERIELVDGSGQVTPISTIVGSRAPRVDVLALGENGGPRTVVVAWAGPGLAGGAHYHVTGVNSALMPYAKTGPSSADGSRFWLALAGSSVGMFVASPGQTTYFRLRCQ